MNAGIINYLDSMTKSELILMIIKLHEMNIKVKTILSDMTWIEVGDDK